MARAPESPLRFAAGDALLIVDVQKDFLPGGSLPVPHGDEVVPVMNRYIEAFARKGLPVFASRDWHPENHCSFRQQGGIWPPHCVQESEGAKFADDLMLDSRITIISKGTTPERDAYSAFQGTDLHERLQSAAVQRLFVGGLATDYCVLNTVKDAQALGYRVWVIQSGIRAVNVNPGDEQKAIDAMVRLGAKLHFNGIPS
jgi:nicotinamidase/pyrazinamidase